MPRIMRNGKVAASYDDGEWHYFDEELQRRMETAMIEGVFVLGGTPKTADDGVIGDTLVLLMPGDDGFDDAYWDKVLEYDYQFDFEAT